MYVFLILAVNVSWGVISYGAAEGIGVCSSVYRKALVHVNGHDRIILVIFSQALYKAP